MNNFSSLLLANHNVVDELVKVVYDDSEIVEDDQGQKRLLFIKYYRKRKVYFNDRGLLLLYKSAIAFFLGINRQNTARAISVMEKSGFFDQNPEAVVNLTTAIPGQSLKRPVSFYSGLVVNMIASRLTKPTQEALDFLTYREQMLQRYQEVLMQVVTKAYEKGFADGYTKGYTDGHEKGYQSGYEKGFIDGQASLTTAALPIPPALPAPLPSPNQSLGEVMQQWQQVARQSERLAERVGDMLERLELLEKNQRTLAGKHEALEDAFHQEKNKKTLGY